MSSNTSQQDYTTIYKDCYDKIKRFLSRSAGVEDAEDLTQEVFIKVHKSMHSFESRSTMYTWIYRIAINTLIDYRRKNKNKKQILTCNIADKDLFYRENTSYLTAELQIAQNEMNECICSYIKVLPDRYKTVIILREYESMSVSDIADIMKIKPDSARVLLKRARKKLREKLQDACTFYHNELNDFSCEKK